MIDGCPDVDVVASFGVEVDVKVDVEVVVEVVVDVDASVGVEVDIQVDVGVDVEVDVKVVVGGDNDHHDNTELDVADLNTHCRCTTPPPSTTLSSYRSHTYFQL